MSSQKLHIFLRFRSYPWNFHSIDIPTGRKSQKQNPAWNFKNEIMYWKLFNNGLWIFRNLNVKPLLMLPVLPCSNITNLCRACIQPKLLELNWSTVKIQNLQTKPFSFTVQVQLMINLLPNVPLSFSQTLIITIFLELPRLEGNLSSSMILNYFKNGYRFSHDGMNAKDANLSKPTTGKF